MSGADYAGCGIVVSVWFKSSAIVEFSTAEDGLYPITLLMLLILPAKGALGLIKSGDGDPTN